MNWLDLTLSTIAENVALDEALLLQAEEGKGSEVLRFWEQPTCAVVLGSAGRIQDDVHVAACQEDKVPIARRCSGGGTVLLGPGCLCFSLVLSMDRPGLADVRKSYCEILNRVAAALVPGQASCAIAGSSDLIVGDRKFAGNAQRRLRRYLLHHGTLLYGFDVDKMGRYLKLPPRRPEYRAARGHAEFVTNLRLRRSEMIERLSRGWQADSLLAQWPEATVNQLVADKYGLESWTNRL